ncbi:4192_t:CDS:2 [Acaulospora colombiana]|uniref:4192_t:CDS:1 n=1 Tax=Acaulospora colombiana TaxID=27376 RepID=A0ACA9MLQ6_9GLOM|nr:4192_t:CDS:2 [Acaulospora colombiana]
MQRERGDTGEGRAREGETFIAPPLHALVPPSSPVNGQDRG